MDFVISIKRYTLVCLILVSFTLSAQEQKSRRAKAEDYYLRMEYANAAEAFERLVDVKKPKLLHMEQLANSYYYIKEYNLAENWYARVVEYDGASKESLLNYANVLKELGKYAEAKKAFFKYIDKYGNDDAVKQEILGVDSAIVWMKNPTIHTLRNEKIINTSLAEFGLIPTSGGALYAGEPSTLIASKSGMTGNSYLRIFNAERNRDNMIGTSSIMNEAFNNTLYHIGPLTTNSDESVLYVTRTYPGNHSEKIKMDGSRWRKQNLELKIYSKDGNGWKEEDFAYNNVKEYSVGHASLSGDEQTLYFASNMPGGLGGVDIWYCERQTDGTWGVPKNAGSSINTVGDEMFPNVFDNIIYFSSTGHVGMGGLDIFQSKGAKNVFTKAQNMGYPINSAADDFSYFVEGNSSSESFGYLSSNRIGGVGSDDIYSFNFQKPSVKVILEGLVVDKTNGNILTGATATLYEALNKSIIGRGTTNTEVGIHFNAAPKTDYVLLGEMTGYHSDSLSIPALPFDRDTIIKVVVKLQPVFTKGNKFVLEDIYYDFDKHNIRSDAAKILDQLVATLRDNPTLKIELSSHTDSRGSDSYNEKLSQRRATSAVEYIISRGIARERLVARGYGEKRLVNRCANGVDCSIQEHQANRRTEIEVLSF